MPRKIRCLSLTLSLVIMAGLAGQTAQAAPLGPRVGASESSVTDYLAAAWGWFTARVDGWGQLAANQARQLPRVWEKDGAGSDPNNGSSNGGTGSGGTGSKSSMVFPLGSIAP